MIRGQTVRPGPGNDLTCIRSALDGGDFVFRFELAPGATGPERHSHDESEIIEVERGTLEVEANGEWRGLGPGESVTLHPGYVHTFRNASEEEPVVCLGTAGPRFERVIEIRNLLELCYHVVHVDPGAVRTHSPWLRGLMRAMAVIAWLGGMGRRAGSEAG